MTELRCGGTMHGRLVDGKLEVKCNRRGCGYESGIVVLHLFDLTTGKLESTRRFADPRTQRKGKGSNDTAEPVTAVRAS